MLIWGGRGTLMEANVDIILDKWAGVYQSNDKSDGEVKYLN